MIVLLSRSGPCIRSYSRILLPSAFLSDSCFSVPVLKTQAPLSTICRFHSQTQLFNGNRYLQFPYNRKFHFLGNTRMFSSARNIQELLAEVEKEKQKERDERKRAGLGTADIDAEAEEDYMGVGPLIEKLEKENLKDPGANINQYEEPTDSDSDDERFTPEAIEKGTELFEKKYKRHEELLKNFTEAGLVLVCLSRSPSYYAELLKNKGCDAVSFSKWFRVLDCYTDPLGWKDQLFERGIIRNQAQKYSDNVRLCKDIKDLNLLSSSIIELGKELAGTAKGRFSVAVDSVTGMLRHSSLASVSTFLSDIRSHAQVSSAFWVILADMHSIRVITGFEYLSSMLASIESITPSSTGEESDFQQNSRRGKLHVRLKRRNGRVKIMSEAFSIEQSEIKFVPVSSDGAMIAQTLVPKVQFNLQLSETERIERAKVVLPFEHQGIGKPIEIYDGRRSLGENNVDVSSASGDKLTKDLEPGKGEIVYFRDSDDERPDSDEDPDDDLDI